MNWDIKGFGLCTVCGNWHAAGYPCAWRYVGGSTGGNGGFTFTWPPQSAPIDKPDVTKITDNGDGTFSVEATVKVKPEFLSEAAALVAKLRELGKRS